MIELLINKQIVENPITKDTLKWSDVFELSEVILISMVDKKYFTKNKS